MKTLKKLNDFFFREVKNACRTSFVSKKFLFVRKKIEMKCEFIQILFSIKRLKINEQFH